MKLIFFRHGDAEDVGPDGTDYGRRITTRGERSNRAVAEQIRDAGYKPDRIVASPLVRAQQTVLTVAEVLAPESTHETNDRLGGATGIGDIQAIVHASPSDTLLLVGHEPGFSRITSCLIGGGAIGMMKSGASCVDLRVVEPSMGRLLWLINPSIVPTGRD